MVAFGKTVVRLILLVSLAQALSSEAFTDRGCVGAGNAITPQAEDMRWLTHGLVPDQDSEAEPILYHLECRN
jgi:hypothetical protein